MFNFLFKLTKIIDVVKNIIKRFKKVKGEVKQIGQEVKTDLSGSNLNDKDTLNKLVNAADAVPLPKGLSDFEAWAVQIIQAAGMPDNDSTRFALAVMIMHLPAQTSKMSLQYFIDSLHKSAANQVAAQVVQDLKAKQQAEIAAKAVEAAKQAEATATATTLAPVASNEQPTTN